MGILDQYRKAIKEEENDMRYPLNGELSEDDREAYESVLKKMRHGTFSQDEVNEAINNSKHNMEELCGTHDGGVNENAMRMQLTKLTDYELNEKGLLKSTPVTDIKIMRAYCPKCGKELISKAPPMYNPFTMEKVCMHECCGIKYNLDKSYPHISIYGEDGEEVTAYGL